ncbi:unnamed protein product, partial [marine sediment metagenome]
NDSDKTVDAVLVVGTFYDEAQQVVGTTFAIPDELPLKPGQGCDFTVVVDPHVARAMDTYSLQTESHKEER